MNSFLTFHLYFAVGVMYMIYLDFKHPTHGFILFLAILLWPLFFAVCIVRFLIAVLMEL